VNVHVPIDKIVETGMGVDGIEEVAEGEGT
jgi:hypothetical protein